MATTMRTREIEETRHKPLTESIAMRLVVQHGECGRFPLDIPMVAEAIRRLAKEE